MHQLNYRLITPRGLRSTDVITHITANSDVKAYSGQTAARAYGMNVEGSGSWAEGRIQGTVRANDMRALYQVYNIPTSESWNMLVGAIHRDKSRSELRKAFEQSSAVDLNYDIRFQIEGNDWGISNVNITLGTILVEVNGVTKRFVTTDPQNSSAQTDDGENYPGGYKTV